MYGSLITRTESNKFVSLSLFMCLFQWISDYHWRAVDGSKNCKKKMSCFLWPHFKYVANLISFQNFFVQAFKIDVDSCKFSILLLYISWDDWPFFMISGSNKQLQQQLEYTQLKSDCNCWWISKMQSDTLEEWYAIKFCSKLAKNATETYVMLQTTFGPSSMNRTSVFEWHKRLKEGRESVRDDERYGRSKEVNTP